MLPKGLNNKYSSYGNPYQCTKMKKQGFVCIFISEWLELWPAFPTVHCRTQNVATEDSTEDNHIGITGKWSKPSHLANSHYWQQWTDKTAYHLRTKYYKGFKFALL